MTADAFVAHLAKLAPEVSDLVAMGLTKREAMEDREMYICKKRPKPIAAIPGSDPVAQLMNTWDLGKIEVGMICFHATPIPHPKGFEIAEAEVDPLVYSPTKGLFVEERDVPGKVIWHVAKDGDCFLEALAKAATCIEMMAREEERTGRVPSAGKDVQECVKLAGGAKYASFYQTLIGDE